MFYDCVQFPAEILSWDTTCSCVAM